MGTIAANGTGLSQADERRIGDALARCLADLDTRGEAAAPYDRASALLHTLVPALYAGDGDAARACVHDSDLPTREILDLVLRARLSVRGRKGKQRDRAERERAGDAALRALADREDPARPEDLDRRKQLAATHRRLQALLTDGVVTVRPTGQLVHANRAARDALGLRLRELAETSVKAIFAQKGVSEEAWKTVRREGVLRAREVDLKSTTGRTFPARVSAAKADGPDPRVLLVFRDLTEIRHIRSRLLETEKLGAMAKIAGSVAHEIRNPLNALFLNADLLEEELDEAGDPAEGITEILRVMREEIERLNEITRNYLSLSKLANATFERLDLNDVVREFAEEVEEVAGKREIRLDLKLCKAEAWVRADRNMLRRVLVNLLQNAFDAAPKGGRVAVGTRKLVHKIKLWVRDSGPGVSEEALSQLFQPFFSTKERGTGLGLYLSREIIMAHDGRVDLRTIKPQGAQATVLLPHWRDAEAAR